jgi:hypothetical protein
MPLTSTWTTIIGRGSFFKICSSGSTNSLHSNYMLIFVIASDFYTPVQLIQYLYSVVEPSKSTVQCMICGKFLLSRNYYILFSRPVPHKTTINWTDHSDHCIVLSVLNISNQQPQKKQIRFSSSKHTLELCIFAEQLGSSSVDEFYSTYHALARK